MLYFIFIIMPILLHLNRLGWILYHKIILINKQLISFELE